VLKSFGKPKLMVTDLTSRQFLRLFVPVEPQIYAYIRAQVPHRPDAEDVFQETIAVLWSKFDHFQPGTNFLAWSLQIAYYEIRQLHRRQSRERKLFSEAFLDRIAETTEAMSGEMADLREALALCLQKLRATDRDLVRRYYGSGATVQSVATQIGRPLDTVKSMLKRSRRSLYECVQRALAQRIHR
jgi:RNA polymerase sigma-70 factor (ECF subfamily)